VTGSAATQARVLLSGGSIVHVYAPWEIPEMSSLEVRCILCGVSSRRSLDATWRALRAANHPKIIYYSYNTKQEVYCDGRAGAEQPELVRPTWCPDAVLRLFRLRDGVVLPYKGARARLASAPGKSIPDPSRSPLAHKRRRRA
jgi:hypothetical protein